MRTLLGLLVALASCRSAPASEPSVCVGWQCRKPSTQQTTKSQEPLPNPGETGELRGTITGDDNGGAPLPGVVVVATSSAISTEMAVVTDAKGAWVLPALPPGTYEVTLNYANNSIAVREVEVQRGQAWVFRTTNYPMDPSRSNE